MSTALESGLDPVAVERLLKRARADVDTGLLEAAQVALARDGIVRVCESFGCAHNDSLICAFSITKAIVASAVWLLIQNGSLSVDQAVADIIPQFRENGKEHVNVKHLLTHSGGFPRAPFSPADWTEREKRLARFARWHLDWEPGSRCEYHPTSSTWVLAELIERVSGQAYRDFVRTEVLDPLGLRNLFLGLPIGESARALPVKFVGPSIEAKSYANPLFTRLATGEVNEDALLGFNHHAVRALGVPGAGAFASASDLATFFQALLHGGLFGSRIWSREMLSLALEVSSGSLRDETFDCTANRSLGLVIAGDDERVLRGFARENSERAFGHNGTGCQIAWADPESGLSFCYLTPSHERDLARQWARSEELSDLAARCCR